MEDFVDIAEESDVSLSRSDTKEVSDEPFDIYVLRSLSRTRDGIEISRIYAGADPDDSDTVIVLSGPAAGVQRFEPDMKVLLSSLDRTKPDSAPAGPSELPGDGGLDGSYAAFAERLALDAGSRRWVTARRVEILTFDPLGQVYRGGAERAGVALFDACDAGTSWRCGRYRVESDHVSLRWKDGTTERRSLQILESSLLIDGVPYSVLQRQDAVEVIGEYRFADVFNAVDWPDGQAGEGGAGLSIRFLEGGKFSLAGFTRFRNPQFGQENSANGRFRIAGAEITLVYRSGAAEVLSLAAFDDNGQRGLMIGGRAFNLSGQ